MLEDTRRQHVDARLHQAKAQPFRQRFTCVNCHSLLPVSAKLVALQSTPKGAPRACWRACRCTPAAVLGWRACQGQPKEAFIHRTRVVSVARKIQGLMAKLQQALLPPCSTQSSPCDHGLCPAISSLRLKIDRQGRLNSYSTAEGVHHGSLKLFRITTACTLRQLYMFHMLHIWHSVCWHSVCISGALPAALHAAAPISCYICSLLP